MSDSVRPHRQQPSRLPCPWDSPGKNTGVGCHFLSNAWKWKLKVKSLSHVQLQGPHGLQPTRLLHSWDFPGKSTRVGCHCLLWVLWPTTVQISQRPLAIILYKPKPLPFIIGDSITRTHTAHFCPYLVNDVLNLALASLSEINVKFQEFFEPIDITLYSLQPAIMEVSISCAC